MIHKHDVMKKKKGKEIQNKKKKTNTRTNMLDHNDLMHWSILILFTITLFHTFRSPIHKFSIFLD